jgi:uncharacterized membrane protein
VTTRVSELHSGPLPHPVVLAGYAEIDASFPQRIIAMAEAQAEHQRTMQIKALEADVTDRVAVRRIERRGQLFALIFGCVSIVTGGVTASLGAVWPGGFFGAFGIGAIMVAFILGRKAKKSKDSDDSE